MKTAIFKKGGFGIEKIQCWAILGTYIVLQ